MSERKSNLSNFLKDSGHQNKDLNMKRKRLQDSKMRKSRLKLNRKKEKKHKELQVN